MDLLRRIFRTHHDPLQDLSFENSGQEELGGDGGAGQQQQMQIPETVLAQAKQLGQQELMNQLMQDPDFQAYQRTKRSGQQPQQQGNQNQQQAPQQRQLPDSLAKMSPTQLVEHLVPDVAQTVVNQMKQEFAPLMQTQQTMTEFINRQQMDQVTKDIQATAALFPDFNDHREEMAKVAQQNPLLTAKQVYVLAKMNKGQWNPASKQPIFTERPQSQQSRPQSLGRGNQQQRPMTRQDIWNNALNSALGSVEIPELRD